MPVNIRQKFKKLGTKNALAYPDRRRRKKKHRHLHVATTATGPHQKSGSSRRQQLRPDEVGVEVLLGRLEAAQLKRVGNFRAVVEVELRK
jgi:hypothetical protein